MGTPVTSESSRAPNQGANILENESGGSVCSAILN